MFGLSSNTTYCPQVLADNACYCIPSIKIKNPQFCQVECLKIDESFPMTNGGCECRDPYAGPRCERHICHYTPSKYYSEQYYHFYCLDNYNATMDPDLKSVRVSNCSEIPNLNGRSPLLFKECPCLNGGSRNEKLSRSKGDTSCHCVRGFTGDLCQIEPVFHRPSPVPTIGVIIFLTAMFVGIGLGLWYRKRRQMKLYARMYQLEPIAVTTKKREFSIFTQTPTPTPPPPQPVPKKVRLQETESGSDSPSTPRSARLKNRRGTFALFAGRNNPKLSVFKKRQPKNQAAVGPTLFEGAEEQSSSQQAPGVADEQFGLAPQYQSTGMGM